MPAASPWMSLFASQKEERRSLREQVCAAIRQALHGGHLKRDERLPSSRQLAADLGVSRVTVEGAYGQLEVEGYVRRQVGGGTFVAFAAAPKVVIASKGKSGAKARLSQRGQAIVDGGGCR